MLIVSTYELLIPIITKIVKFQMKLLQNEDGHFM